MSLAPHANYRECPLCESEQPFPLRHRVHPHHDDVIQIYISCRVCPYQQVIRDSTPELERLYIMRNTIQATIESQIARYGVEESTVRGYAETVKETIQVAELELRRRIFD